MIFIMYNAMQDKYDNGWIMLISYSGALHLQLQSLKLNQILHVVGEHGLIEDVNMQLLSFLPLLADDLVDDSLGVAEILPLILVGENDVL